jgi:GT2 family glycosyltransferase
MTMPLVIVPTYMATDDHYVMTEQTLAALSKHTDEEYELMVIDDCSPRQDLVRRLDEFLLGGPNRGRTINRRRRSSGVAATINQGLAAAREEGQDAVILTADVHIVEDDWLEVMRSSEGDVVGPLLLYPNGLVQHAGVYFSIITRQFGHIYRFSPGSMPNVGQKRVCPVTGAFQYIRHNTLEQVGLLDEGFKMGYEDVDYCIRVFQAGLTCVYQPLVRALHHEHFFRGTSQAKKTEQIVNWEAKSLSYLHRKYKRVGFADWVPTLMWDDDLA